MSKSKISDDEFENIVANSFSIAEVLRKTGNIPAGGNYRYAKLRIKRQGINVSHFTGKRWNTGKKLPRRRDIQDYLNNRFSISSNELRKRLLEEKIFERRCYSCGNSEWMQAPISLELEHKNGNHDDNSLDNLTILCPNCHAQTEHYRGKKLRGKCGYVATDKDIAYKISIKDLKRDITVKCRICGKETSNYKYCSSACANVGQSNRPPKEQLLADLSTMSKRAAGRKYGVANTTIKSWLIYYGVYENSENRRVPAHGETGETQLS